MKLFQHQIDGIHAGKDKNLREIAGFPGYYVDESGNIFSDRRRIGGKPQGMMTLSPVINFEGYTIVTLYRNKKRYQAKVHRTVLSAFNPVPGADGLLVRHLDGDKSNNHVSNLAWGTPAANSKDMIKHGRSLKGIKNHACKLHPVDVIALREYVRRGHKYKTLSQWFGIGGGHLSNIICRRVWKHV